MHRILIFFADNSSKKKDRNPALSGLEDFKLDFKSRIWFTYRTDLPTLPDSRLKSDIGWGCMLRCGQMLLAQAFVVHFLRRGMYAMERVFTSVTLLLGVKKDWTRCRLVANIEGALQFGSEMIEGVGLGRWFPSRVSWVPRWDFHVFCVA